MNRPPATIVFDLDGTLVDTAPDLAGAMNHVLRHFGRCEVDVDDVRDMVGHGARRTIERGLALTGGGDVTMVDKGFPLFMSYYSANICAGSRVWDGVEAALVALASSGHTLCICTNKPVRLAEQLIGEIGWVGRFASIVGGDSIAVRKPDPAHVIETVARAGGVPSRAVFVGDSRVDVEAARAAGLPIVLTSFGYSDLPAAMLGADHVIDHFDELIPALAAAAPDIFGTGDAPASVAASATNGRERKGTYG